MVGAARFELAHNEIKTRGLTAWLSPFTQKARDNLRARWGAKGARFKKLLID